MRKFKVGDIVFVAKTSVSQYQGTHARVLEAHDESYYCKVLPNGPHQIFVHDNSGKDELEFTTEYKEEPPKNIGKKLVIPDAYTYCVKWADYAHHHPERSEESGRFIGKPVEKMRDLFGKTYTNFCDPFGDGDVWAIEGENYFFAQHICEVIEC